MIAQCYMCGKAYTVSADKERWWREESDGDFDPEDWQCEECLDIEFAMLDAEPPDEPEPDEHYGYFCPECGNIVFVSLEGTWWCSRCDREGPSVNGLQHGVIGGVG